MHFEVQLVILMFLAHLNMFINVCWICVFDVERSYFQNGNIYI